MNRTMSHTHEEELIEKYKETVEGINIAINELKKNQPKKARERLEYILKEVL